LVVYFGLLVSLWLANPVFADTPPQSLNLCLDCHAPHYAALGTCIDCHAGNPATRRVAIAHTGLIAGRFAAFTLPDNVVTRRGEQRLKDYACRRCHVSDGKGNRLAANLDMATYYATPEELDAAIKEPVLFMPQFYFTESQRVELVNALLAGSRRQDRAAGEPPVVVHFEGEESPQEREFEKQCGACHRSLTERYGGLGTGLIGPNLSGLLTSFYPQNFGDKQQRWSVENLEKWLKNPRQVRQLTQMPPQVVKPDAFRQLVREIKPLTPATLP
jgi:cytochrome c2